MNKIFHLLFFVFYSICHGQVDTKFSSYIGKYSYTFLRDTTNVDTKVTEQMSLAFNNVKSIFFSDNEKAREEAFKKVLANQIASGFIDVKFSDLPRSNVSFEVYRDKSEILVSEIIFRDRFIFQPNQPIVWNLIPNETKLIEKYSCKMAYTVLNGRKFFAWYTEDIPIPEGPYRFKNLPGLILEVYDEKGYSSFSLIGLKKDTIEINNLTGNIVTQDQFLKKRKEFRDDPTLGMVMDKNRVEQVKINVNKKNNFLD